jgi:hypothetical protein
MASRSNIIMFTKRGPGTGEGWRMDLIDILLDPDTGVQAAEIASVSSTYLEQKIGSVWSDVTDDVTIGGVTVTNGAGTNSAVKGVLAVDKDDAPPGGGVYRLWAEVVLDNGQGEAGYVDVQITASAALAAS